MKSLSYYIANRIALKAKRTFSKLIVKIAIIGITLGLAVMIIAFATVSGFKNEISQRITGFTGHIQISKFDLNNSFETSPVMLDSNLLKELKDYPSIVQVNEFATKAGIISSDQDLEGVVLKGVGKDFDWTWFQGTLISGETPNFNDSSRSNDVILSKTMANRLQLKQGDDIIMHFIQDPPRARKFTISGIYETGIDELDKLFVIGDIRHIQRLNGWEENTIKGYEVHLNDMGKMQFIADDLYDKLPTELYPQPITNIYPGVFDWLKLLDTNAIVIWVLMLLVTAINLISALLILILERTRMIGILKSLGTPNKEIRKIFLYYGGFLVLRGMVFGNIIGIGLCWLQLKFRIITLPIESYYVSFVPIHLNPWVVLALNACTLLLITLIMIIPSMYINRIAVVKAIRMD